MTSKRKRSRAPRVLCLSFFFPPSRASGVYRARATANYLAAHGWDVTVFAAPLQFLHEVVGSVDEKLAETVDPGITVVRPYQSQFAWEHDIRKFGRLRRSAPILAAKLYALSYKAFPEHYGSWGLAAVGKALRMHARRRFDLVVATGNPFVSFASAWMFSRLTGVPYVVDYRDSWTLNIFTEELAFPAGNPAWAWERRVMRRASGVVFVNEALRRWHASRYPATAGRMMVVPNGWDQELLEQNDLANSSRRMHGPLRFAYIGTISSAQPVEQLVEAFRTARQDPELEGAQLDVFGHLGFFKRGQAELKERLGIVDDAEHSDADARADAIAYRGPVSKTEVAKAYDEADVLVFMAGGSRYVTSGKIFEYMATGRPIVSVHAPEIAATEVLDGYPLWFNANSLDPEAIAKSMVEAGRAARRITRDTRVAARTHADTYAREAVLAPFEKTLRTMLSPRRRAGLPEEP